MDVRRDSTMTTTQPKAGRKDDVHPIAIRLVALAPQHIEKLKSLAALRGWRVLGNGDSSPPEVWIASRLPGSPVPAEENPFWIDRVCVEIVDGPSDGNSVWPSALHMVLPAASRDEDWIAVIENAASAGRRLRAQHERITHLERVSITDAMTGVYNRMHLVSVLSAEFKRFERSGVALSCIMVDLDHFKNINDTYGHSFGDKILIAFSRLLKDSMRESDVVGRYGGEEFLCILPGTDLNGAAALARKLREVVERNQFVVGFFNVDLTASFGVASSSLAEVASADQLLQWADRALYRAKQNGRNQVCLADGKRSGDLRPPSDGNPLNPEEDKPVVLFAHEHYAELSAYQSLVAKGSCRVIAFSRAEPVLEYLSNATPTLAIIQGSIPSMTGLGLIHQIKSRATDQYFPIVLMQSSNVTSMQDVAYRAGADDVVSEHITDSEFERRTRIYLRLKNLHDRFLDTYERLTGARARLVKAERLSALGQMASGVAHDFNNVLSAILGRTQRLLWSSHDPAILRELEVIHKAASDGAETIRRIQDFSRSISRLDAYAVPIADVVEDCLQLTRMRWKDEAEKHGIKYKMTCTVDPTLAASANPAELREVFLNLIINALDAMPNGGEVQIRSGPANADGRFPIEIVDNGTGMEPAVARRVFEPFYTTKDEKGTGLGLSITYGIVTRLGGQIEVQSKPGAGTTFRIWFPPPEAVEGASEEPRRAAAVQVAASPHRATPLSILLVEDERSVRDLMVDVLREEGHEVKETACAREAMKVAEVRNFDVLITDLGMPDLPGWDVARFVKDRSPETFVLITSGWGDEFSQEYLSLHGVDQWLSKPIFFEELFAVLAKVTPLNARRDQKLA